MENKNELIPVSNDITFKFKWIDLDQYSKEQTNHLYVISKFIDNSIQSFEDHLDEINELKIQIIICQTKNENNITQKITIIDNAYGMNEKELEQAIIPNNTSTEKQNLNKKNMYGIGMKLAAFWLSKSLKIHTKQPKTNVYQTFLQIKDKNLNEEVHLKIYKKENNDLYFEDEPNSILEHGTKIELESIRISTRGKGRNINTDAFNIIKEGLEWRYKEYLKSNVKINFKFIDLTDGKNNKNEYLKPLQIHSFNLKDTIHDIKEDYKDSFNEKEYIQDIEEKIKPIYEKNKDEIDQITKGNNFYKSLINGFPLEFEYDASIGGGEVKIKWGIIEQHYANKCSSKYYSCKNKYAISSYSGFTLTESKRAIYHGPNSASETDENVFKTYPFCDDAAKNKTSGGKNTWRRLYGEIDLTGIIRAEKNKKTFLWKDNDDVQRHIQKEGNKIWNLMRDILNEFNKINNIKSKNDSNKSTKKTCEIYNDKYNLTLSSNFDNNQNIMECPIDFFDSKLEYKLCFIACESDIQMFDIKYEKNDSKLLISVGINENCKFWNDLIAPGEKNIEKIKGTFIVPLAITYSILKIRYDHLNDEVNCLDSFLKECANLDFDELFQVILRKI